MSHGSIWCGFELYQSVIANPSDYFTDTVTCTPGKDNARAVVLTDGDGVQDETVDAQAERESFFPQELVEVSERFSLDKANASQPSDRAAILSAIGTKAAALEATVRVSLASRQLHKLLQRFGDGQRLSALLEQLRASQLRRLTVNGGAIRLGTTLCLTFTPGAWALISQAWRWVAYGSQGSAVLDALPASLSVLELRELPLRGQCERLAHAVRTGRLLQLQLTECNLNAADAQSLAVALASPGSHLRALSLA